MSDMKFILELRPAVFLRVGYKVNPRVHKKRMTWYI